MASAWRGKIALFRPHLGMGDGIISNALIRRVRSNWDKLLCFCKEDYMESFLSMFGDLDIQLVPVKDDPHADELVLHYQARGIPYLPCGNYFNGDFNSMKWDREVYKQHELDPKIRWKEFKLGSKPIQVKPPKGPYAFFHDDPERGFKIVSPNTKLPIVKPNHFEHPNIFSYVDLIKKAAEIHVIDSCFLCLTEFIGHTTNKLFWYKYARSWKPPEMKKKWRVLQ